MSTQSIACGACGATVPYGRLACPSCGELLASVASGGRVVAGAAAGGTRVERLGPTTTARPATPSGNVTPERPALSVAAEPEDAAGTVAAPAAEPADAAPSLTDASSASDDATPAPAAATSVASRWFDGDAPLGADTASGSEDAAGRVDTKPDLHAEPDVATAADDEVDDEVDDEGVPLVGVTQRVPDVLQPAGPLPGAYVPPVVSPAGPPAPARAWAGASAGAGAMPAIAVGAPVAAPGAADASAGRGSFRERRIGPAERTDVQEWAGWMAVGGASLALMGFLLPWAATMIGASGIDYFDRWGLAGPGHPFVVIGLLVVLALALLPSRLPVFVRLGLPSLVLGVLLLGLAWPYLWSDVLGRTLGVYVVALGAILLIVAGVVALATDRHAGDGRPV